MYCYKLLLFLLTTLLFESESIQTSIRRGYARSSCQRMADMLKLIAAQDQPVPQFEENRNPPRIIAVAGGKGGVGKSLIAANLGVALAKSGKRVVLVDLDLGAANLHTCLGLGQIKSSISDFFSSPRNCINDLIFDTSIPHLGLISGAANTLDIANLKYFQKAKIIRNLSKIETDYVIIDLGAGTTYNTLDFFLAADFGLVTITPDPASIENSYRFIKSVFMRKLKFANIADEVQKLTQKVMMQHHSGGRRIRTLADFFAETGKIDPDSAARVKGELESIRLQLIVNQITGPADIEIGHSFKMACRSYFGINVNYAAHLYHDDAVLKTLRNKRPFLLDNPKSRLSISIERLAHTMLEKDIS